ncbi:MAG: PAS domain-containing protein, partial [bacterium]
MLDLFEPNLLENIFLNAPIGIFITDIQRKIIYANIRSAGIHGYKSSADLMEQTFPNFLDDPTDLIKNLCDILDFSINKKKVKYEFTVRSQKRIVETTMSVLKSPPNSPV